MTHRGASDLRVKESVAATGSPSPEQEKKNFWDPFSQQNWNHDLSELLLGSADRNPHSQQYRMPGFRPPLKAFAIRNHLRIPRRAAGAQLGARIQHRYQMNTLGTGGGITGGYGPVYEYQPPSGHCASKTKTSEMDGHNLPGSKSSVSIVP